MFRHMGVGVRIQFSQKKCLSFRGWGEEKHPQPPLLIHFHCQCVGFRTVFDSISKIGLQFFTIFFSGCLNLFSNLFIGLWSLYEMFSSLW